MEIGLKLLNQKQMYRVYITTRKRFSTASAEPILTTDCEMSAIKLAKEKFGYILYGYSIIHDFR